ncbi:MAG TPA: GGDEF domain-containing protein, partial [Actinomycetota bacterium]|nr:GGDEF domain-containing protein [Actinomycetota bacterium]
MATSLRRLILMAGAAVLATAVMVTRLLRRGDYGELMLALGATVLFLLVLIGLNSLRRHELIQQALYDSLTGLANRTLFADRLSHALGGAIRHGRPVTVLVTDLNGFKAVNDTFGHAAGDQLLIEIANRLRDSVRPTDTVARLGGDEFAVLLEDAPVADAVRVAERLLEDLITPIDIEGREVFVDGSIGIAESPSGSVRAEALLRDADAAMYTAKTGGKGAYQVFQPEFH